MAKQKKVEVNGKEYTLQSKGYRWYMETVEKHTKPGQLYPSQLDMWDEYFEHIIVEPKVSLEDFEDEKQGLGGLMAVKELMAEAERFLTS